VLNDFLCPYVLTTITRRQCRAQGFSCVWTTFDHGLYEPDKDASAIDKTPSGQPLQWIQLNRFTRETVARVETQFSAADDPPSTVKDKHFVTSLMFGHQRSLERWFDTCSMSSQNPAQPRPDLSQTNIRYHGGTDHHLMSCWKRLAKPSLRHP
jgi:hypothetical protein